MELFRRGEDITPFLRLFGGMGFNVVRVFVYTPIKEWGSESWEPPPRPLMIEFLELCRREGFLVELVLLTDDDPERIEPAKETVRVLTGGRLVLLEIGNEPTTHKEIDTRALWGVCEASRLPYSSGNYEPPEKHFGKYMTVHTTRDSEWPRRAHDLKEYFEGEGPNKLTDPPHHYPIVADEPNRPDLAGFVNDDFKAYAGACALLGAGATFHFQSGKFGQMPTRDELGCAQAFAEGLNFFPPDAPLGQYSRIDGQGLRGYKVGPYVVRIRPNEGFPVLWKP